MPKRTVRKKSSVSFAKKKRGPSSLFWFLILFILLPVIVWAVYQQTQLRSKAQSVSSIFGNALDFRNESSQDSYAFAPINSSFQLQNPFTFELWLYAKPLSSSAYEVFSYIKTKTPWDFGHIINLRLSSTGSGDLWPIFRILFADKYCCFEIGGNSGGTQFNFIKPNTWNHVAVVSLTDEAGYCEANLYINGKLGATKKEQHNGCLLSVDNPQGILLAKPPINSNTYFSGQIDELQLTARVKYSGEFTPPTAPFLTGQQYTLLHYHFNDPPTSQTVIDSSKYLMHGQLSGTNVYLVESTVPTPSPTPTPNPIPISIKNGSFEVDGDNNKVPDSWVKNAQTDKKDVMSTAFAQDGKYAFVFGGNAKKWKTLSQVIEGPLPGKKIFYLSGWAKTVKAKAGGAVRLVALVVFPDGSLLQYVLPFPEGIYDWTGKSGWFMLDKPASRITVRAVAGNVTGSVYFDNVAFSDQPMLTLKSAESIPLSPQPVAANERE